MTEQNLTELLADAAQRVPVGPPPVPGMVTAAARVRRRRTFTVGLAGAAAVAAVVGGTSLFATDSSPGPQPPVASPGPTTPPATPPATPPGTRLVGLGHAAIVVPEGWGTNATRCGTPQEDTVVIDVGAIRACATGRPEGVDSVEVTQGEPRFDFTADETVDVDGVRAERQATTCETGTFGGSQVCAGTVYIPSLGVSFRAESSTSAADVDRILEQIRVVPGQVGVPGYRDLSLEQQGRSGERYLEALREAGLTAELRTRKVPGVDPGYVLEVSPGPGTMLQPGDMVTMTVVAEPEGPADEVRVGMNSVNEAGDDYHGLGPAQIREGATITLAVGDRIWAYADGRWAGTLAGRLDGASLKVDGWKEGPNYPHSWVAVAPGRTRVTLTITADGEPVVLGVVTVHVR